MRKIILFFSLFTMALMSFSEEIKVDKSVKDSITKDYDQDGVYSAYEKAMRSGQESVYVKLPEKRGYWYTMLDRIKAEEDELMSDEINRMRKR